MFLSKEELAELTGYRRASKQVAQLTRLRVPFYLTKDGKPKVARTAVEGRTTKAGTTTKTKTWSPPWADGQL